MKQVVIKQGNAVVEETPAPLVEPDTILVQVDHSCISIGTEMAGLKMSGEPLWKRALKQPDNVKKVLKMAATSGFAKTKSVVQGQLAAGTPSGYSAAGHVIAIGSNITDIEIGDRVACAGAQCAHHAEIIRVPRNLSVKVPDSLSLADASTVTLGAIAMQGVRRAQPTLGETFVVVGLGILGQLTSQLLKAHGCRVIGVDLDPQRIQRAESLGLDVGIYPEEKDPIAQVARLTDGHGADGVIITAATPSNEVISSAFNFCRKKARVVLVGDVGLDLKRADFYAKELDFYISCSYGPGRYDSNYEEHGLDYPIGYVRWTENRNMAEYLQLIAEGKINVEALTDKVYPIEQAQQAYADIKHHAADTLIALLQYPQDEQARTTTKITNPKATALDTDKVNIALIGAGGFAKGMHLPNLDKLGNQARLYAVMSRTGHNALATAKQFSAQYGTTEYQKILDDKQVDAVIITTRHHLHCEMALAALQAGKHVLLEKPLAMSQTELDKIKQFYAAHKDSAPILLTGFNRRFSSYMRKTRELTNSAQGPLMINYRMNAGHIAQDHWVHGPEGGGRNIGEACHIYDVFTYLTDSQVTHVQAQAIQPQSGFYGKNDNFMVNLSFANGSIAHLTYTALGSKDHPKELCDVYVDGKVIQLADYQSLNISGSKAKGLSTKTMEKGQLEELTDFIQAIKQGGEWPIPLWQQLQASQIALDVEAQLGQA